MKRALALVMTLGLAGCATPGSKLIANSQTALSAPATPVLDGWGALAYAGLPLGERRALALDEKAQIVDDGRARRYAAGYVLPRIGRAYSVSVSSARLGTPADPAILYPELVFLDEQHRPVPGRARPRFTYRSGGEGSGDGLYTVVFINDTAGPERYLVVTSRPLAEAELALSAPNTMSTTPVSVAVRGAILTWMIPVGRSQAPTAMRASPSGRLVLSFDEYRLRKVGEKE